MKYLLIIGHDDDFGPNPELISRILEWNTGMAKKGILKDSNPLVPWQNAKTIRIREGALSIDAGSFSKSEEKIAAYALINCDSEEKAIEVAVSHPMAKEAVIELRQVWENIGN